MEKIEMSASLSSKAEDGFGDVVEHFSGQAGIHADPEDVVHHEIGVGQLAEDAVFAVLVDGLAKKIAGEHEPRANLLCLERGDELLAREGRILTHPDGKAEPRRVGAGRGLGQDEKLVQCLQRGVEITKICSSAFNEMGQLLDLRCAQRGLHIRRFEVVADV